MCQTSRTIDLNHIIVVAHGFNHCAGSVPSLGSARSICHLAGVVVVVESELLMILQFGGIVSSELLPPARPLSKLDGWRL